MNQTENTAIVLRIANYRENDRMLTLFSPTKGKLDVISRGCRKPRSPLLNASELFALGDYQLYSKASPDGGVHYTLTSASLIETFYPLRLDYDKLCVGTYMLSVIDCVVQEGENHQSLFMLLLHVLSQLTFSEQNWKILLTGFLLYFASIEGFKPRISHCSDCGRKLEDGENAVFSCQAGGLICKKCIPVYGNGAFKNTEKKYGTKLFLLTYPQIKWLRDVLLLPPSKWNNAGNNSIETNETIAAALLPVLIQYVEQKIEKPVHEKIHLPL